MPEDHVGIPFEGINQYRDVERGVRTFSKTALDTLIKESGFHNTYFYYPYPDYKFLQLFIHRMFYQVRKTR